MMQMSVRLTRAYHKQIDRIHAAEDLRAITVTSSPYIKGETARQDLISGLRRRARGEADHERVIQLASNTDLKRWGL